MACIPVPTLQELSLTRSAELLLVLCKKLEIRYGHYEKGAVITAVQTLQTCLLKQLGAVVNDLCKKAHELYSPLSDARILFILEMHKYVKSFHFQDEIVFDNLKKNFMFWAATLGTLINVTVIDIRQLCCDSRMIDVICDNCTQLEVFRYSSRLCTAHELIQGFVTYESLSRLLELKKLRFIQDTFHFKGIPKALLKDFFQELLPRLENFELEDIKDLVLDNRKELDSLQITHLSLYKQNRTNLSEILRLCPNLQHLHLRDELCRGIFNELVKLTSQLTSLRVDNFLGDFLASLSNFLFCKGNILTDLAITTEAVFSVNEIVLIGECCPQLQSLELNLNMKRRSNPYFGTELQTPMRIYSNLKSLSLRGDPKLYVDGRIVDLFLRHDLGIEFLSLGEKWIILFEKACTLAVHSDFDLNPANLSVPKELFPNLHTLDLWIGSSRSVGTHAVSLARQFYTNCKKLNLFHLHSYCSLDDDILHFFAFEEYYSSHYFGDCDDLLAKGIRYMHSTVSSDFNVNDEYSIYW